MDQPGTATPSKATIVAALNAHTHGADIALSLGEGWWTLLWDLHSALELEFPEYHLLGLSQDGGSMVFEANPKLRTSRRSWTSRDYAVLRETIEAAQEESSLTCELCGKPSDIVRSDELSHTRCLTC